MSVFFLFCFCFLGLKSFYGKKSKLKNEIAKRKHENYVKEEDQQVGSFNLTFLPGEFSDSVC